MCGYCDDLQARVPRQPDGVGRPASSGDVWRCRRILQASRPTARCVAGVAAGVAAAGSGVGSGALLLYMALLSAFAFATWSLLLKHNPVGMLAAFNFLIPVFGVATFTHLFHRMAARG